MGFGALSQRVEMDVVFRQDDEEDEEGGGDFVILPDFPGLEIPNIEIEGIEWEEPELFDDVVIRRSPAFW